jgi:hypothetical protein
MVVPLQQLNIPEDVYWFLCRNKYIKRGRGKGEKCEKSKE